MALAPDRATVISLDRRPDRRAALDDLQQRLGFNFTWFSAVDGQTLSDEDVPRTWQSSKGAYANMLSHRAVLEQALPHCSEQTTVLVLEDDAVVPVDFQERVSEFLRHTPAHWESIYLGGKNVVLPKLMAPGVNLLVRPIWTIAYILRGRSVIERAIEQTYTATFHWDIALGQVLATRRTCFAPTPWIITPSPSASDIPDSNNAAMMNGPVVPVPKRSWHADHIEQAPTRSD